MATETRSILLKTLRSQGSCTVKDLAEAADVSPVSVRHHLSNLQADGLVEVKEVRHGVGRPRHMFSLSDKALELFPTRYYRLTNRILEEIKDRMPEGEAEQLLSGVARAMAADYKTQVEGLPIEARLERLVELLADEGFEAQAEYRDGRVYIRELSCPYYRIGQEHPEVCVIDQTFIGEVLSLPVKRINWIMDGDRICAFRVDQDEILQEIADG